MESRKHEVHKVSNEAKSHWKLIRCEVARWVGRGGGCWVRGYSRSWCIVRHVGNKQDSAHTHIFLLTVCETGVQIMGAQLRALLNPINTRVLWWFDEFNQLCPHDAERRQYLGQLYVCLALFFSLALLFRALLCIRLKINPARSAL